MYLLSKKFQTYIKHKIKKITLKPQIKLGNSKNMFKEKCVWESEISYLIARPKRRKLKLNGQWNQVKKACTQACSEPPQTSKMKCYCVNSE